MPPMPTDNLAAVIAVKLDALHEDMQEMKGVQRDMALAITKLALVEERQSQAALALERVFKAMEKMEERLDKLEEDAPLQRKSSDYVFAAIWGAAGLLVMFAAKQLGLV